MTKTSEQTTYLTKILEKRRERVEEDFAVISIEDLRREAFDKRASAAPNRLQRDSTMQDRWSVSPPTPTKRCWPHARWPINTTLRC